VTIPATIAPIPVGFCSPGCQQPSATSPAPRRRRTAEIRRETRGGVQSAFEVLSGHFRPSFDLVPVLKNVAGIVVNLVLKFGDHRRWSESERVGLTRRRLGRRVAARPASHGGRAWPNNFHFRLRTCWCMRWVFLTKFRNL
jgi:hypothetical protein